MSDPGFQQPQYGPHPPHAYGPVPPGRRGTNRLAVALAIGLPLLIVLVIVIVVATSGGGGDDDDPATVAERFVAAINDGDRAAAETLLCPDAIVAHGLDEYLAGDPRLHITEKPSEDQLVAQGWVSGTWRGEDVTGGIHLDQRRDKGDLTADPDAPWCVSMFGISPK